MSTCFNSQCISELELSSWIGEKTHIIYIDPISIYILKTNCKTCLPCYCHICANSNICPSNHKCMQHVQITLHSSMGDICQYICHKRSHCIQYWSTIWSRDTQMKCMIAQADLPYQVKTHTVLLSPGYCWEQSKGDFNTDKLLLTPYWVGMVRSMGKCYIYQHVYLP